MLVGSAGRSIRHAGELTRRSTPCWTSDERAELASAAGAPEPDPSLGAFLERVALVADSDQIPTAPDGEDAGVVTLMTLHTAKGLEFDTVFLTGLEDGVFPHQRALTDRPSWRRSAGWRTSGSPGPGSGCTLTRAVVRSAWGAPQHNPPSRFLAEIPDQLIDWRRTERVR